MRRLIAGLTLLSLLVTGCGTEGPGPREAVAAAAEHTAEAGTARIAMTFAQESEGFSMTLSSEGVIDFVNNRAELRMEMPGMPEGADGEGAITMIADGTVLYTQLPIPDAPTPWIRIDAAELGSAAGGFGGSAGTQNPSEALDYLRGVSDDVTEVGREEVRDVDTTRYEGTVDLNKAVDELAEEHREQARRSVEMLGTDELPVVVWIDDDGLLRRMTYEMDLSRMQVPETPDGAPGDAPMAQPQGTATVTMELYDFGVEVDIAPPPDDEVTDFGDMELFDPPEGF
ncbi:MAG TPA: hypothetical protein VM324_12765 [Egibacteraceae bacterium]|jgi:hypothetical protein|nr:hypothetical protein [Egibacteraceae bacterium]